MTRLVLALAAALAITLPAAPAQASVPASGFIRNVVTCPAGRVAVAGGEQVTGEGTRDFRTALQESAPAGSSWLIAFKNNDSVPHNTGFYAVCAVAPAGYEVVRRTEVVPAGGFLRSNAVCPSGKVVLGGGAQVVGEGTRDFRVTIQETSNDSVLGGALSLWKTAVSNNDSVSHNVGFYAVCATAPAGYEIVRRDVTIAAGGFLRTTANCPANKLVFGGGAEVIDPSGGNYRTVTQEIAPGSAGAVGVYLTAIRNNGSVGRTIAFNAVCATIVAGYQIVVRAF